MGIDGVGKPSGIEAGLGIGVPSSVASKPVQSASIGSPIEATSVQGSEALGRLERGELSIGQYLEIQVEHATCHLGDQLSTEELGFVKTALRQQLESDPVLLQLVSDTVRTGANE